MLAHRDSVRNPGVGTLVDVPSTSLGSSDSATLVRRTMTAEAAVLVFVAIVTVSLTTASAN